MDKDGSFASVNVDNIEVTAVPQPSPSRVRSSFWAPALPV
jgi:hypothetical protein